MKRGTPFWQRMEIMESGCWEWRGAKTSDGYGALKVDGQHVYAHRRAYALAHGPIPHRMLVKHSCDNPPCCNPAHLSAGTKSENALEAFDRGLARGRIASCPRRIVEMRTAHMCGLKWSEIGPLFGLTPAWASELVRRAS